MLKVEHVSQGGLVANKCPKLAAAYCYGHHRGDTLSCLIMQISARFYQVREPSGV